MVPTVLITQTAQEFDLDRRVVAAIVHTESSGNPSATRYEPHYRWTLDIRDYAKFNGITVETEEKHQKTSWGYMQVMGGLSRELGHKGPIPDLIDPEVGLFYGCKYLKKQLDRYGNYDDAVAAYNAGSARKLDSGVYENERYVDRVLKKARELGFRRN